MALMKFKRSAVPAKVPAINDLALGELAINTYDGKLFLKKDDGTQSIVEICAGGGGSGTVTSVSGTGSVSGLTLSGTVTTSGSLTLGGELALTSGDITGGLGFTPYNATNPSGYTSNVGTVTSVAGTGTVNGLTLTGTVTSSGSLTLGGTLSGIDLSTQITGTLGIANGGHGATTAPDARSNLGLGSIATQDADDVAITGGAITGTTMDSITNHVGADHIHYKVKATENLVKGNVVKVIGYNAGEDAFRVAKVTSASDIAIGVVYQAIADGDYGSIINTGVLEGINTSAFEIGTVLYPNTSGGFTTTKPTTGKYQALAFVVRSGNNNGSILIEASEPQPTSLSQFTNDSGYTTNTGTVTSITAGTGLSGGTITSSGTIALENTSVSAGSYTNANITVDAQGRLTAASSGSGGSTAVSYPQNVQSGNYTLVLADAGKHIYSENTGAQTITIPTNASVAFPIGTLITIVNDGTTKIVLSASGVTIKANGETGALSAPTVYSGTAVQLLKTGTNAWKATFGVVAENSTTLQYLVIAGGGGGGYYDNAGGGGAGGMRTGTADAFSGTTYTISVGAGGAGTPVGRGSSGGNSVAFSITSIGGGGGGGQGAANGLDGGSGGGGGTSGTGGNGTGGQGNNGAGFNGGGGGAGAAGSGRNGGNGLASSITGTSVTRAGGGGAYPTGTGGTGGGGAGGYGAGTPGTANTGGGGGGGDTTAGGSGVVIISSPTPAASTTGSPVVTTSGGNTIYQFNTSGTITF